MVTHIVLFKFENANDAQEAQKRLLALAGRIEGMSGIEAGLDITRSARSFDLGLVTRHDSAEALAAYQVHPLHQEVATFIRSKMSAAASVDFEA